MRWFDAGDRAIVGNTKGSFIDAANSDLVKRHQRIF